VKGDALADVKAELLAEAVTLEIEEDAPEEEAPRQPPAKKAKKTLASLTVMRPSASSVPSPASSPRDRLEREFSLYDKYPNASDNEDPLDWWKIHQRRLPLLSQFVRRYLSVQATSCASERLFSKAGQVVTAQRAQMKPEKADMLIFLRANLECDCKDTHK